MSLVDFEIFGRVALIRLNRPEQRNAINIAVMAALRTALDQLENDEDIDVGVLTGAGSSFCAGMDLAAFAAGERPGLQDTDHFAGFVARQRAKPVIAAVNGPAVAGGFEIVLACDMAIAADTAVFGLPEVKRGLIAGGGGAFRLPRRIPAVIANELLLTGALIDAPRALALGLVNRVTPAAEVVEAALQLAATIAANAPLAVRASLELARSALLVDEAHCWALNDRLWSAIETSADAREGAVAFKQKRRPEWGGR